MSDADDIQAIRTLIDRQFRALDWTEDRAADWAGFAGDFHAAAQLFPAARPAIARTVGEFVERMQGLAEADMRRFRERMLGARIKVFGTVAVAMAVCEITENDDKVTRGIEAMLLVKEAGAWKIVAQAWDTEAPGKEIAPKFYD